MPAAYLLQRVPTNFIWQMSRRADGTHESINSITLAQGETALLGFNVMRLKDKYDYPTSMTAPTCDEAAITPGATPDVDYGYDADFVKFLVVVDAATTTGDYYIETAVTLTSGSVLKLKGKLKVVAS